LLQQEVDQVYPTTICPIPFAYIFDDSHCGQDTLAQRQCFSEGGNAAIKTVMVVGTGLDNLPAVRVWTAIIVLNG
jgi:hypothetical protein